VPERLNQLIQDLSSSNEATRRFAVEDLGDLRNVLAIPHLAGMLSNASAGIREPVVDALSSIGKAEGELVVLAMLPALRSEDTPQRNAACEVLRNVGEPSVTHLGKLLSDDDKDVRKFAVDVLALIASVSAGETLTKALDDVNVNVAAAAAEALGQIKCGTAVEALTASLQANGWVRCSVARSLGQIGGPEALRSLNHLVGDEDEMVAFTAVQALGDAGDISSLQCLLYLLEHTNSMIVSASFGAVERILDRTDSSQWRELCGQVPLEPLMKMISHTDAETRRSAARLLGKVGNESVVPPLVAALLTDENQDDEEFRELALQAIVSIAPHDITPIAAVLNDAATSVEGRCELVDVLGRVGRPEAFSAVAQLLDNPEVILRRVASRMIAGLDAERASVLLCKSLTDSDGHVRANAIRSLGEVMAGEAVSSIVPLLEDPCPQVREAAAWAIGTIGGIEASDVVTAISPLLYDEYPDVRESTASALVSIASDNAIAAIEELACSDDEDQRLLAVKTFENIEPRTSIDRLLKRALSDSSQKVCARAIQAFEGRPDIELSDEFLGGLDHNSALVRSATLKFLAKQQPGEWSTRLCEVFLNDPDIQVRHDCAIALGYLNPPGTIDVLIEFLTGEPLTPFIALAAISALARIGDPNAEDVLGELAGNDDPEIYETAAAALEELMESETATV